MDQQNKVAYKAARASDTELNLEYAASLMLRVFQKYDVDNGGTLQRRELRHLLRNCGSNLSTKQCEGIIDNLDQDGDGEMNFAEFMSFLGRLYQLQFFGNDPGEFWTPPAPPVPSNKPTRYEPPQQGYDPSVRTSQAPMPPPKPRYHGDQLPPRPTPRSRGPPLSGQNEFEQYSGKNY